LSGQSDGRTLEAPLFVAWFQCVVSIVIIAFITAISKFLTYSTSTLEKENRLPYLLNDCRRTAINVGLHVYSHVSFTSSVNLNNYISGVAFVNHFCNYNRPEYNVP